MISRSICTRTAAADAISAAANSNADASPCTAAHNPLNVCCDRAVCQPPLILPSVRVSRSPQQQSSELWGGPPRLWLFKNAVPKSFSAFQAQYRNPSWGGGRACLQRGFQRSQSPNLFLCSSAINGWLAALAGLGAHPQQLCLDAVPLVLRNLNIDMDDAISSDRLQAAGLALSFTTTSSS